MLRVLAVLLLLVPAAAAAVVVVVVEVLVDQQQHQKQDPNNVLFREIICFNRIILVFSAKKKAPVRLVDVLHRRALIRNTKQTKSTPLLGCTTHVSFLSLSLTTLVSVLYANPHRSFAQDCRLF